ncbi:MAG: hypothetical protein KF760_11890 [Candidatus Eremiobacteraeota bacterium]|nr:hypothetical protein [Candidatus Eremiobacteraeota bacterium]
MRAAIFAQLERRTEPLALEDDHPLRPALEWLGVPLCGGTSALSGPALGLQADEVRAAGILPEVVYSCLVQTWWHPGQSDYVARTRSEIYACFDASQLELPGWNLTREALEQVNAYRLQELTPHELLESSREFWQGECSEPERMEGWLLLHLDRLQRLQDVADCLFPFHYAGDPRLALSDEEARQWLRIPEEVAFSDATQILGPERVARLLGERRSA